MSEIEKWDKDVIYYPKSVVKVVYDVYYPNQAVKAVQDVYRLKTEDDDGPIVFSDNHYPEYNRDKWELIGKSVNA